MHHARQFHAPLIRKDCSMSSGPQTRSVCFDRTGFPFIHIRNLNAWISWHPVSVIQLEYFLSDRPEPRFDNRWYNTLKHVQNRVSPGQIDKTNVDRLFATQLIPAEIEDYCAWLSRTDGHVYRLPSAFEWKSVWDELKIGGDPPQLHFPRQQERVRRLLENTQTAAIELHRDKHRNSSGAAPISLAQRMFMENGVRELCAGRNNDWFSHGRALQTEDRNERPDQPLPFPNPSVRSDQLGFRLLREQQ